ncbi:ribonuclease H-like domain-containing protein [Aspergillus lucknowensis]|uniref:Ribonuclease H-like domain-containing protein n=1 Tax=Aspergillus lucknowensis TaxID=176173 RepID=A0ABR4LKE2_9EURO
MSRGKSKAANRTPTTTLATTTSGHTTIAAEHAAILQNLASKCHSRGTLLSSRYPTGTPTAPASTPKVEKRKIVAIDCEMVGIGPTNTSYLGQIVAVDVLTGETILDICVNPPESITSWRTRYSGLSPSTFKTYGARNRLVRGVQGAQAALFRLIDRDTILVGHALQNDLVALNMVHLRCVDTQIVTKEAVAAAAGREPCRVWGLRKLAEVFLGRRIQGGQHDCAEDTRATRDLLLACTDEARLREWAEVEARIQTNFPTDRGNFSDNEGYDDVGDFL